MEKYCVKSSKSKLKFYCEFYIFIVMLGNSIRQPVHVSGQVISTQYLPENKFKFKREKI